MLSILLLIGRSPVSMSASSQEDGLVRMMSVWKAAVVLVALAAIACGAAAEVEMPTSPAVQDSPLLSENEVVGLVYTNVLTVISPRLRGALLVNMCLGGEPSATYKGDGTWVVVHGRGNCTFVVNDRTGKVTGP